MDKRYYKKHGPSSKERLRCPLCGKISDIGYFSQNHHFAIYRFTFAGRGKISCSEVTKSHDVMSALTSSIVNRLLYLLHKLTGLRYVPDTHIYTPIFPPIVPKIVPAVVRPYRVIVE